MTLQSLNPVGNKAGRAYPGTNHFQKLRGPAIPVARNILTSPQKTDRFQSSTPITPPLVRFGQTSQLEQFLDATPFLEKDKRIILNYLIQITDPCRKHVSFAFPVVKDVVNDLKNAKESAPNERTQPLQEAEAKLNKRATEIQQDLSRNNDLIKAYLYYEMAEIYRNRALIAQLLYATNLLYADQQNIPLYKDKCKENYKQGQLLVKQHKPYLDKWSSVKDTYNACDIFPLCGDLKKL